VTGKLSHNAGYLNETYKRSRRPKITLMRIKKSPYSQSKSQNKFKILLLSQRRLPNKDLQKWADRPTQMGQN
jgi:hypothetical protein